MKLVKTILAATSLFWALHFLLFAILFAGWFFRFILQWFVGFGTPQPETSFESLLRALMNVLMYPARLLADGRFGDTGLAMALSFVISSVIWGGLLGAFIYAIQTIRARANAA